MLDLWTSYNGEYLVAYPPSKDGLVRGPLGEDFDLTAKWQRAKLRGEQDVKARPGDPYAWWSMAKANLRLGNVKVAAGQFDRAVQLGVPTLCYLYRQQAFETWTPAGGHQKTLELTQRALRAYPSSQELLRFRNLARQALDG